MEMTGIKVKGRRGTWYVIARRILPRGEFFLLEHEIYGDEVECLVVNEKLEIIAETADNFWECLEDLEN